MSPTPPPNKLSPGTVIAAIKSIRPSYAFIALALAVTLWYTVTVRDKVETWVDVQVQFKGAPDNLVITEGLINRLSVRVRVARGLSRGLTGREGAIVVDLSSIARGSNAIAVTREMLPFASAYEVVEISPSRIFVVADSTASRQIALESAFVGKLAADLFVKSIQLDPPVVTISGADSLVSGISRIRLPVPLSVDMAKGQSTVTVVVPMPANVIVKPPQVAINIEVGIRTRQVKLTRDVLASGYNDGHTPVISPKKVTIVADIPESLSKDVQALEAVKATVALPPDVSKGPRSLPVSVILPENSELVSVTPATVTVTIPKDK